MPATDPVWPTQWAESKLGSFYNGGTIVDYKLTRRRVIFIIEFPNGQSQEVKAAAPERLNDEIQRTRKPRYTGTGRWPERRITTNCQKCNEVQFMVRYDKDRYACLNPTHGKTLVFTNASA